MFKKTALRLGVISTMGGVAASAHAAIPAAVQTALDNMQTDGVAMATLVLVAIIAVAAILFLKKALGR